MRGELGGRQGGDGVLPVSPARVEEAQGLLKAPQGSILGGGRKDLIAPLPFSVVSAVSGLAPVFIHSR